MQPRNRTEGISKDSCVFWNSLWQDRAAGKGEIIQIGYPYKKRKFGLLL